LKYLPLAFGPAKIKGAAQKVFDEIYG